MTKEKDFLLSTGMVNRTVYAGIQSDDCVVWRKVSGGYQNFSLCNHSCVIQVEGKPTGGSYICDASFVFGKGSLPGFAPRQTIVGWTKSIAAAHVVARDMFFARHFGTYCEEFQVPPAWAEAIRAELTSPDKKVEVNRFGGSPEMLPECSGIIADCKAEDLVVNLTTPGRRFLIDPQFTQDIAANPPHMLALSFDDMGPKEIARIAKMDLDAIKAEWKTVSLFHGQRQKAFEGFYTARLMRDMKIPVTILFNVVIHPRNVEHLDDILVTLTECVPGCFANPYPVQAFGNKASCWAVESLPSLHSHILHFIRGTLENKPGVTRRLHYYITLEAAFRKWGHENPKRLAEFMSGIGAWDSTLRPGAYRYTQIGKNTEALNISPDKLPVPGGHLGCFWNPGWALCEHVGGSHEELAEIILMGVVKRGREFASVQKSTIMPRLMFDVVATELGLPDELTQEYLSTRKEYAGF